MTPLVVIRPQPGCEATVAAARAMGLDAYGFPLFDVTPVPWDGPPAESVDALLLGSANALRHAGPALTAYTGKPAYCVGAATAAAAREAGLAVAAEGRGGLQPVLGAIAPDHASVLRLAGEERVALATPAGISLTERVVYASTPRPMPPDLVTLLAGGAVAMLHSGEAGRHFARSCDAHGIDRQAVSIAAIGPRAAIAAGNGWRRVASAALPDDRSLLALAGDLCQMADRSKE